MDLFQVLRNLASLTPNAAGRKHNPVEMVFSTL